MDIDLVIYELLSFEQLMLCCQWLPWFGLHLGSMWHLTVVRIATKMMHRAAGINSVMDLEHISHHLSLACSLLNLNTPNESDYPSKFIVHCLYYMIRITDDPQYVIIWYHRKRYRSSPASTDKQHFPLRERSKLIYF